MVYLTRKEHFNAAHRLYNKNWSAEKNAEVFGPCANANFHGHNFDLYVTVKGEPDVNTGFIMNAKELSVVITEEVISRYDHKNLNLDVDDFEHIQPSTENFAKKIWNRLEPRIKGATLHKIKLVETENIFVEYYGEH
ncbi:MAG: 6-pyruvoyltetrahydropterin/6-carboxytetrahydropterin synthase [Limisphaerales bacterium]|jgi:6-pyruvoyltetrahydropterin/6-carboxytetrahydropterin synthase